MLSNRVMWALSICFSLVLTSVLFACWYQRSTQLTVTGNQLTDLQKVEEQWAKYAEDIGLERAQGISGIPTGVFIQSMDFRDSSRVYLAGYLWMHFARTLPDAYNAWKSGCDGEELPFIFADQVDAAGDIAPELRYQYGSSLGNLCGWYFEVTLREKFDYLQYPFDQKTVSLRLWTRNLLRNVLLYPDFAAYPEGTGASDLFGYDSERMVIDSLKIRNTFFSYSRTSFSTTFGTLDHRLLSESPELNYNVVLTRSLVDGMVEHLLGVIVVLILLFATMLVASRDSAKAERHGFNTAMVLGACSALFFVILLAHIQIRAQFSGTTVVYLETYFYLTYALLIGTTVNTYLFSEEPTRFSSLLHYRDNLLPKLLYWPLVLSYSVAVTLVMLY